MMRKIQLFGFGLLVVVSASGQDLKKTTVDDRFFRTKEVFYVFKDNQQIRQGEYKRTSDKFKTLGQFDNNKRTGIWKSFDEKGELVQTIDFASNSITPNKISDDTKYWIRSEDDFKEIRPDQAPAFIGTYAVLYRYIGSTVRYPAHARRLGVEGKVFISVVITKDGRIIDEKVEKGLGYGLDEEALRAMQEMPDEWVPGKVNGESIDMKILIPISFRLG